MEFAVFRYQNARAGCFFLPTKLKSTSSFHPTVRNLQPDKSWNILVKTCFFSRNTKHTNPRDIKRVQDQDNKNRRCRSDGRLRLTNPCQLSKECAQSDTEMQARVQFLASQFFFSSFSPCRWPEGLEFAGSKWGETLHFGSTCPWWLSSPILPIHPSSGLNLPPADQLPRTANQGGVGGNAMTVGVSKEQ